MFFRTALAVVALCASTLAAHASTITLDTGTSTGGTYRYDYNESNSYEAFAAGSKIILSGFNGITGASAAFTFYTISFTDTSATFTVNQAFAFGGPGVNANFFTITSNVLTRGAGQFSIQSSLPQSGSLQGPVASAIAVTPEPSGIILLGTGLLGVVGATRRRLA